MLINRQNIADMFRGFQVIYQDAWMQAPSMYEQIATVVPSTAAEEHYGWLGTMPRMREWLGDRVVQSLSSSDYTIKNKPYEVTIGVDRDHIEGRPPRGLPADDPDAGAGGQDAPRRAGLRAARSRLRHAVLGTASTSSTPTTLCGRQTGR
jgi:hypothetical protein